MEEIPPQIQNQLVQLRKLQQQAQSIMIQRSRLEALLREVELAIDELQKASDEDAVYMSSGEIMIRMARQKVIENLSEKKETYSLRLKTLERQEERILKRSQELQSQIEQGLTRAQTRAG